MSHEHFFSIGIPKASAETDKEIDTIMIKLLCAAIDVII